MIDDGLDGLLGSHHAHRPRMSRRRGPRRRHTGLKLLLILILLTGLVGGGLYVAGRAVGRIGGGESIADFPGPGDGSVIINIPSGSTARDIGRILTAAGVVETPGAFVGAAAADGNSTSLQPGFYQLKRHMSASGALAALLSPATQAQFKIVITPGMTTRQVIQLLAQRTGQPLAQFEAIVKHPAALGLPSYAAGVEGYLFPGTYDLPPDGDPTAVMKMFVDQFNAQTASLDIPAGAARLGLKPQQIVTIASIIEREVKNADEAPKVARVIYNRLADRSGSFPTLGLDSTTRYALNEYEGPLTAGQLALNNPYNTRKVRGLPPGAISNPGMATLQAALNPASGTWLYFVSMPRTGVTEFATTQAQWNGLLATYHAQGGN